MRAKPTRPLRGKGRFPQGSSRAAARGLHSVGRVGEPPEYARVDKHTHFGMFQTSIGNINGVLNPCRLRLPARAACTARASVAMCVRINLITTGSSIRAVMCNASPALSDGRCSASSEQPFTYGFHACGQTCALGQSACLELHRRHARGRHGRGAVHRARRAFM